VSTRRELLASSAAALGAALVRPSAAAAGGIGADEPAAMRTLIMHEDAAASAYELAASATGVALFERIGPQHAAQAHVLRVELEALTVPPPHHEPGAEQRVPAALKLSRASSRSAGLDAAIELEQGLAAVYLQAARVLVQSGVLRSVATILGSHAQQLAVLRAADGRPPLDEPTVKAP
jgi:hypothetical protein